MNTASVSIAHPEVGDEVACPHSDLYVGRVSWPPDLRPADGEPVVSGYVCGKAQCRDYAAAKVLQLTGRLGEFVGMSDLTMPDSVHAFAESAIDPMVVEAIREMVKYNWADERNDYDQQDDAGRAAHVFRHLTTVANWLDETAGRQVQDGESASILT